MSDDMDATAKARAASGREMWNPHVIQPAPEAGEPVPPPIPMATFPPDPGAQIRHDDDDDEMVAEEQFVRRPALTPAPPAAEPEAMLVIVDTVAKYKGQVITLEERDVLDITRTCLQAAHRRSTSMLKDLEVKIPRKRRKRKAKA